MEDEEEGEFFNVDPEAEETLPSLVLLLVVLLLAPLGGIENCVQEGEYSVPGSGEHG